MDRDLLELLAGAFVVGGACTLTLYRVHRLERLVRKAHFRIDRVTGSDWVRTGQWKSRADLEEEGGG
jgi:hypothetical protein